MSKLLKLLILFLVAVLPCKGIADKTSFEMPETYNAYPWVNFCPHHLQDDPEGCSSWCLCFDKKGNKRVYPEESNYSQFPYASISPELIEQFQNLNGFEMLPTLPECYCDYGVCLECQQPVIRSFAWKEESVWDEEENELKTCINGKVLYKCDCAPDFFDKKDEAFQDIVSHWSFCQKPACFAGYFDKHLSAYFANFCSFTSYCCENPECNCYWFENAEFRRKILNLIDKRLWDDLLGDGLSLDLKNSFSPEVVMKLILAPFRKFMEHVVHSVFYTDLRDSLREFDRMIFLTSYGDCSLVSHISQVKWDTFYESIIAEIRPLFLEEYKNCYNKHPHPKIAAEIKIILDEMAVDNYQPQASTNSENHSKLKEVLREKHFKLQCDRE